MTTLPLQSAFNDVLSWLNEQENLPDDRPERLLLERLMAALQSADVPELLSLKLGDNPENATESYQHQQDEGFYAFYPQ